MIQNHLEKVSKAENITVEDGLLQNQTNPMTLSAAQNINPYVALRWRWRICRVSDKIFDITQEGLFYTCGEYVGD